MEWDDIFEKGTIVFLIAMGSIFAICLLMLITGLIISLFPVKLINTMQDGQHTGYVTAVDTSGLIWKTTEVYFKTDAQSSQEDSYCVIDETIKEELLNAQQNRRLVTLHYDSYLFVGIPLCGWNGQIITGIS